MWDLFVLQGYGKELWQAHGRFRSNGGCGYVLKPNVLMENTPTTFNPLARMDVKMVLRVSNSNDVKLAYYSCS